ncbi:MAG: phosphatase PAP2 family protein [Pseudomonadales bacterium]|nr:phosphatase PAP2 family protein [Pseudomonadales bacterium]
MENRAVIFKQKASDLDFFVCQAINGLLKHEWVHRFFVVVSRLGDGVLWYALILSLPILLPEHGIALAVMMTVVGLGNVYVYKRIKRALARPRPFMSYPSITQGASVLDEYSFPSGHTLHAVTFTIILVAYNPLLSVCLVPFAVLTAMSRVVLGVHFPSDVIVGALIGVIHGWIALLLLGWLQII